MVKVIKYTNQVLQKHALVCPYALINFTINRRLVKYNGAV